MRVELTPDLNGHSDSAKTLVVNAKENAEDSDHRGVRDSRDACKLFEELTDEHGQKKEEGDILLGSVMMMLSVFFVFFVFFSSCGMRISLTLTMCSSLTMRFSHNSRFRVEMPLKLFTKTLNIEVILLKFCWRI